MRSRPVHPPSDDGNVELSIVTMLYKSRPYLPEFLAACRDCLGRAGIPDHEILFVNDGSPDDSQEWVLEQRNADPRIRLVELSRNFGHHHAALAGLSFSRGRLVFITDCDLEVSPSILQRMLEVMRDTRCDVVYGMQEQRKGALVERIGGRIFWRIFNALSHTTVPESVLTERLMTRGYVDALLGLGDKNLFLAGMMYWTGFKQIGIPVVKSTRTGKSTYTLRRRVSLLIEAVTSFSTAPLKLALYAGVVFLAAATGFAAFLLVRKLLYPEIVLAGFTSIMLALCAVAGMIITLIGVLGLYIGKLFVQVQGRPTFIVRDYY